MKAMVNDTPEQISLPASLVYESTNQRKFPSAFRLQRLKKKRTLYSILTKVGKKRGLGYHSNFNLITMTQPFPKPFPKAFAIHYLHDFFL